MVEVMQTRPSIVNIINFIRGIEPREPVDLYEPVDKQLKLLERYHMRGTFLMQYDAMLDSCFVDMLRGTPHEIGGWLEIVEPMCVAAGIPWRGRFPWDWHSHVGFTVGYSPAERERLVDVFMALFHSIWGTYPRSVGSWMIDAHTLDYMARRYGISASCNCKDQWGTDGYTLWGGYYGQAYYPSKSNAYAPAQNSESQIPIPVFKMLGSDPIYQYDAGLSLEDGATAWQHVITLEPVYQNGYGGGDPAWTKWFFDEVMTGSCCVAFRYAQAGQENSFGWQAMEKGLEDQFIHLRRMLDQNLLRVETLEESAAWFKESYPMTPNAAITALSDWKGEDRKSVWFCSRHYRANLFLEGDAAWIRDLTLFNDGYRERYLDNVCDNPVMVYDNLPVMDGNRWSGNSVRAGCYFCVGKDELHIKDISVWEEGEDLFVSLTSSQGLVTVRFTEDAIRFDTDVADFRLVFRWGKSLELDSAVSEETKLSLTHEGYTYALGLHQGKVSGRELIALDGKLTLGLREWGSAPNPA